MKTLNMNQKDGDILYFNKVAIRNTKSGMYGADIIAIIYGKIKDSDAYVILVNNKEFHETGIDMECALSYRTREQNILLGKYGYPNRNLELEWGAFNGYLGEYIVPRNDLELET